MLSESVTVDATRLIAGGSQRGPRNANSGKRLAAIHEEAYKRDVTDRERLYGDSFACEWCRQSNLSPDDFE